MPEFVELFLRVAGPNPVVQGLVGGLIITGFNLVGALAILVWRSPSARALDAALAFAAGVMLTASFTSLILPGIEVGGLWPVVVGIVLGALVLDRADVWVPHIHVLVTGRRRPDAAPGGAGDRRVAGVILFIVAITLHNMPEGLAVGVAFGGGAVGDAITLMLAIGMQNLPEGLAVAVAARNAGMGDRWYAAFTGFRAGGRGGAAGGPRRLGRRAGHPPAALRDGVRGRRHAVRHQRRDHPRDPRPRPRAAGDARHDDRRPGHARARRGAGLTCGSLRRSPPKGGSAEGNRLQMNSVCAPAESSMKSVALMMPSTRS
jgi:zinc transporter, ZIP family